MKEAFELFSSALGVVAVCLSIRSIYKGEKLDAIYLLVSASILFK